MKFSLLIPLLAAAAQMAVAQTNPPAAPAGPVPLRAILTTAQKELDVFLLEHKGASLFYRPPNVPDGVMAQMPFADVQDCRFVIEYDQTAVFNAVRERRWITAAQTILTAVTPALPFIDLPGNDSCDQVAEAARYLAQAARTLLRAGEVNRVSGAQRMDQARDLFGRLATVTWYHGNLEARIRAVQCEIDLGRVEAAQKAMEDVLAPDEGTSDFGLYWLTKANLLAAQKDVAGAADAAARSLAFESKDMDTFVEASLLSARCYEDLLEWHRARDVYYELARLFAGTEPGDRARARLDYIMKNGLTKEKEAANVAKVFFGTEEDLDKLAMDFLNGVTNAAPAAHDKEGEKKP